MRTRNNTRIDSQESDIVFIFLYLFFCYLQYQYFLFSFILIFYLNNLIKVKKTFSFKKLCKRLCRSYKVAFKIVIL